MPSGITATPSALTSAAHSSSSHTQTTESPASRRNASCVRMIVFIVMLVATRRTRGSS